MSKKKTKTYETTPIKKQGTKISVGKISGTEIKLNAANKLGRYIPEVYSGTGVHGSPEKDRKKMKQKDKVLFKEYL